MENVDRRRFEIRHFLLDVEAVDHARSLLEEKEADFVIFGDLPEMYQLNVLRAKDCLSLGSVDIIDLPNIRKFFMISNLNRNYYVDFEEKKNAIIQARKVMKNLDIKKINTVLIASNSKNEVLEGNILKVLVKESKIGDVEVQGVYELSRFLSRESQFNIYNSGVNLLIMKNYEMTRVFINTLRAFSKVRIASLIVGRDCYAVDFSLYESKENIYFTLIILEKLFIKINKVCLG